MTEFLNQLGPYQLHTEFQRGPIAHLYRATDTRDGQLVLVHLLAPTWTTDPTLVAAFLAAGKAAQALQHANIVPILACEIAEGQPYLVTPFISDQTLGQLLRRRAQRLDQRDVLAIVEAVAAALDAAHAQGIIHGGVGLDTIYITASRAILLDGFYTIPLPRARQLPLPDPATTVDGDGEAAGDGDGEAAGDAAAAMPPPETASTTALAAPPLPRWPVSPFMAPEQARDESTLDRRTDVYSLGAITYTLLLGRLPFTATDRTELVRQIVDRLPPQPESIEPTIATGVAYVLRSVLAKDPAIRYSSAGEFASALAQGSWLASVAPAAGPQTSVVVRPRPPQPARQRAAWVALLLLLLTVLAFVIIDRNQSLRSRFLAMLPGADGETNLPITIAGGAAPAFQPTADAAIFTPEVMVDLTPATPTTSTPSAIRLAQVATPLQLATVTTTTMTTATNASGSSVAVTPTLTMTARAGVKSSITTTITATATSVLSAANDAVQAPQELRIDPLGLLDEGVAAGSIVINGEAAPGTRLRITIDDQPIGETLVKNTGTWSIITTLERLGDYTVVAEMIDINDQVTSRATGELTVVAATPRTPAAAAIAALATITETLTPTRRATQSATPRATATQAATLTRTAPPTATPVPPTATTAPTRTATVTNTARPTATLTAPPTATKKALPTATNTNTPAPTMTSTRAATATNPPRPTNTLTPTATNTAAATATNTPRPTATNTRVPTATSTNTPRPTATNTNTPRPTATFTPVPPTATNTPLPTATQTNTPLPTATFTPVPPTVTNTPVPTWTPAPTNTPPPTPTNTPVPSPTVASGQVTLVEPSDGTNGGGQRIFRWNANFTPSAGTGFELVFWRPGEDPLGNGFGLAAPTTETGVTVDLDALDDILGERLDSGDEYRWGILLVKTEPYERISYLGGGYTFLFSRSNGGGGNDGGPSSGE